MSYCITCKEKGIVSSKTGNPPIAHYCPVGVKKDVYCRKCANEYHEFWDAMWAEYYEGQK